jgi:hypothetical protein
MAVGLITMRAFLPNSPTILRSRLENDVLDSAFAKPPVTLGDCHVDRVPHGESAYAEGPSIASAYRAFATQSGIARGPIAQLDTASLSSGLHAGN